MRGRFYASDVDFFQLLSVLQNITELFLKKVRFFGAEIESRQFRDIRDIQVRFPCH